MSLFWQVGTKRDARFASFHPFCIVCLSFSPLSPDWWWHLWINSSCHSRIGSFSCHSSLYRQNSFRFQYAFSFTKTHLHAWALMGNSCMSMALVHFLLALLFCFLPLSSHYADGPRQYNTFWATQRLDSFPLIWILLFDDFGDLSCHRKWSMACDVQKYFSVGFRFCWIAESSFVSCHFDLALFVTCLSAFLSLVMNFIGNSSKICTGEHQPTIPLSELISNYVLPGAQREVRTQFEKVAQSEGLRLRVSCSILHYWLHSCSGKFEFEVPFRHKDGSIHYIVFSMNTIFHAPDHQLLRALGTCIDMTEHYRYRREIELSRSKSLFLAALSHELRKFVFLIFISLSFPFSGMSWLIL